MVIIMMLLAALGVHPYCDPMTAEEQATKDVHEQCDDIESRVNMSVARCRAISDNKCGNNDFAVNQADDVGYYKQE